MFIIINMRFLRLIHENTVYYNTYNKFLCDIKTYCKNLYDYSVEYTNLQILNNIGTLQSGNIGIDSQGRAHSQSSSNCDAIDKKLREVFDQDLSLIDPYDYILSIVLVYIFQNPINTEVDFRFFKQKNQTLNTLDFFGKPPKYTIDSQSKNNILYVSFEPIKIRVFDTKDLYYKIHQDQTLNVTQLGLTESINDITFSNSIYNEIMNDVEINPTKYAGIFSLLTLSTTFKKHERKKVQKALMDSCNLLLITTDPEVKTKITTVVNEFMSKNKINIKDFFLQVVYLLHHIPTTP